MKLQQSKLGRLGWRILATLYASAFLITLLLAYTGNLPAQLNQIPFYDKIGHVVLYGIATYLGHRVLGYRAVKVRTIAPWCSWQCVLPLFPLLFSLFTVTEEALQSFSPNRTLDAVDLVASLSGIALGYWLAEKSR